MLLSNKKHALNINNNEVIYIYFLKKSKIEKCNKFVRFLVRELLLGIEENTSNNIR